VSKNVLWNCDSTVCKSQEQAWELPLRWLSLVFINSNKEYRYCFCSYKCLIDWANKQAKYYESELDEDAVHSKFR